MDHSALALTRAQSIEPHVGCDAARPGAQAAIAGEGAIGQGAQDLLKAGLDQIIVVAFSASENAVQGVIDDSNESVMNLSGDPRVSLKNGVDEFFIGGLVPSSRIGRTFVHLDGAEPGTLGGAGFHDRVSTSLG
jgi:hypothetical protein